VSETRKPGVAFDVSSAGSIFAFVFTGPDLKTSVDPGVGASCSTVGDLIRVADPAGQIESFRVGPALNLYSFLDAE
jgi:hypothetical protein